jgi:hypothetical protein
MQRLNLYAAAAGRGAGPTVANGRALVALDQAVRRAASTQAVIDSFVVIAGLTALALLLASINRAAPRGPASHLPLFAGLPGAEP